MQELAFWKAVTVDESNFLEAIVTLLTDNRIRYCVIAGQGVNAYVDPLVSSIWVWWWRSISSNR
ncbi:MAG TPA: hypothetical protein VN924_12235 [Bryobacteraceae bacterium]|nr:hypothetical protein [Bryobacteraceae bacterium]